MIWDLTDAHVNGLTSSQFIKIPSIAKEHLVNRKGGKTAYLCPSDSNFGMLRMYSAYAELEA